MFCVNFSIIFYFQLLKFKFNKFFFNWFYLKKKVVNFFFKYELKFKMLGKVLIIQKFKSNSNVFLIKKVLFKEVMLKYI